MDDGIHFRFHDLKPSERARFVGDLIALSEAGLIDIGRMWPKYDSVYTEDIAPMEEDGSRSAKRPRSKR